MQVNLNVMSIFEDKIKATDIPFVSHIGIKDKNNEFLLDFKEDVLNHIKIIHASAQFTLAETQSLSNRSTIWNPYFDLK